MIGVEEAKLLCQQKAPLLGNETIPLQNALHRILATDLLSPFALPSFRQSAMDGYAVRLTDSSMEYDILAEISAGNPKSIELKEGQGVRIFTGAAVPDNANAVIMQEWTEVLDNNSGIRIAEDKVLKQEMNIRPIGEQIQQGAVALEKGLRLNAAALGLIQSFGMQQVNVVKQPLIHLLITGDELVEPGQDLSFGKIYESNGISIQSALNEAHFVHIQQFRIKDDLGATIDAISYSREHADVIISSGGISVGDHDHMEEALTANYIEQHFYKVKQKPGKPLYFGSTGETTVFALPGNPASALSCVHEYVIPHLNKRSGCKDEVWSSLLFPVAADFYKKGDRAVFLKAYFNGSTVEILDGQASSMLQSYAKANCIAYIPADSNELKAGNLVRIRRIS